MLRNLALEGDWHGRIRRRDLAYGTWLCKGGRVVAFNRGYHPVWSRHPGGEWAPADRNEWVENIKRSPCGDEAGMMFYTDFNCEASKLRKALRGMVKLSILREDQIRGIVGPNPLENLKALDDWMAKRKHLIKASEALIAWTPAESWKEATRGQIKVGRLLQEDETDWTRPYAYTGGAAYTRVRDLEGAGSVAQVFVDFHTVTVRDGIDPKAAHAEFLNIEEYAEHIAADIEGSLNPHWL
jgi:hypothetical protein